MNTTAHHRKKDPIRVQEQLLEAASIIVANEGIASLSLNAVAKEAGVSKGGLLHHFPGKIELIQAVFKRLLGIMDKRIALIMAKDPIEAGRFSRAYLTYISDLKQSDESRQLAILSLAMPNEPIMRQCWRDWMLGHLAKGDKLDNSYLGTLIRYAADGLWLSELTEGPTISQQERSALVERLLKMTFEYMADTANQSC
ncbi:TPA: TetR family transcriptional regulator [Proteus mirabilis]|nr:TetR family transcriptional regulator [Proteus mirabilis]